MKIKYMGITAIRLGDKPLSFGDVLDLSDSEAKHLLESKLFSKVEEEPPKTTTKTKAKKKAVEPTIETTEEES